MIAAPRYPPAGTLRLGLASWSTRANLALYRRCNGRLAGRFLGMPKLLLATSDGAAAHRRPRP